MIAAHRPRAPWIASTSSPSWLRWKASTVEPVLVRHPLGRGDVVGERRRAVDLRLALAEQVEVGPVQQQHDRPVTRIRTAPPVRPDPEIPQREPSIAPEVFRTASGFRRATSGTLERGRPRASVKTVVVRSTDGEGGADDGLGRRRSTTSTPAGPSSTNVRPSSAFLSRPISATRSSGRGPAATVVGSSYVPRRRPRRCSATRSSSMRPSAPGQLGGVDQPDADRLAVGQAVLGGDLQGVGQRVAVVEQRPPAALALVGGHDRRP